MEVRSCYSCEFKHLEVRNCYSCDMVEQMKVKTINNQN